MKLFLEKTTGLLVPAGAPVGLPRDSVAVEIQFFASGVAELVTGGAVSLKLYSPADLVTPVATFSAWNEDATAKKYTATLDVIGALGIAPQPTYLARISYNTSPTLSGWFHVGIGDAAYQAALAATTITVNVYNNTGGGGSGDQLTAVTGLTGGGANNLDGVVTVGVAPPVVRAVVRSNRVEIWRLRAGTDAENTSGGIVRPDDYNAGTNAKVWELAL